MKRTSQLVVPDVVAQHAEECAFLRVLRDGAVDAPNYHLDDLAHLDERIEAHIDGLRIAGDPGWELSKQQLAWSEAGEVFTGAVLAFESGEERKIQEVLVAGTESLENARGLVWSLGWLDYDAARHHIDSLLGSQEPALRYVGIAACAIHRRDSGVTAACAASIPLVRVGGVRAAGELGRVDLLPSCRELAQLEDPDCWFWAARSAALLGDVRAAEDLMEIAESDGPRSERACDLAARRGEPGAALEWQESLASRPECLRLAIRAAEAIGDPVLVPWLLEMMKVSEFARLAGEAFSSITGVDLASEDLEGEPPMGSEAGPTENPEDDDVSLDPDEDLLWPEPQVIESWWSTNRRRFSAGSRYLGGEQMRSDTLAEVLKNGSQRRRGAAALELALLEPVQSLFAVHERADRQKAALGWGVR